jgi:GSH-dependent disulfide-bond oxidoreductase
MRSRSGWLKWREFSGLDFENSLNVALWNTHVAARPRVQRGIARVTVLVPAA